MERERMMIKMEPRNGLEMRADALERIQGLVAFHTSEPEKRVNVHQQENQKPKKIKTEVAINYGENQTVADLKKELSELKNQVLEKDRAVQSLKTKVSEMEKAKWMDNQTIKDTKTQLSISVLSEELLRQKNVEANQTVEELSRKISACEEEKKKMKRRESENVRYVEDLRRQNLEASRSVEKLRRRIMACEEEKKMAHQVREEMKFRELEINRKLEELRRRVMAWEEETKMADRVREEMKHRESENIRCVKELRRRNLEANRKVEELRDQILAFEEEKMTADRVREEMKVRESDLRCQVSRAEQSVKEMKERGLEARKAAELNMKRFGNVVPIAEDLCKLLRMNVDDLVSVKEKFVWDGEGLISSSAVTTTNGQASS
ncbi:hypothetical protein PHJA_000813600 [Phtheirospermum japonicum]|uniref:Uncharacterized protein n=1 Tax=Phtheirospermum japonicum TaxID=374723 RepID=A0A830BP04_9LAMI|nr:hypothetical protein PHJA_000813600 [Phtheirospermum japonicum]